MKSKSFRAPVVFIFLVFTLLFTAGCSIWRDEEKGKPVVIKAEDFSIFLFESSEEIYRANVKSPEMWEDLREVAHRDLDYSIHYNWLYDTYGKWDEHRRAQLEEIMTDYHHQPMSERLIQKEKQEAGLGEILKFIKDDRFFSKNRSTLVDFYTWYGTNYALPHYQRIKPVLQRKAEITAGLVEKDFDLVSFMDKESGITLKKKPSNIELLLNMRVIGASGFYRDKDSLSTIQWTRSPEKIWLNPFHELGHHYIGTFTRDWSFKYLVAGKLKKDEKLMARFNEDVPYSWEGWIEENLVEGFARYLIVRKGIARDVGEGIYVFDNEYAQALVNNFNPQKTSLKDFTLDFLKHKYKL